jgi:hypothetical protein
VSVEADATVERVRDVVADRLGVDPNHTRLLFGTKVLNVSTPLSAIEPMRENPISFFGTKPRDCPAPSEGGEPADPPQLAVEPVEGSPLARLTELGFETALAERALALCNGVVDAAAELLFSGNVSPAGAQALLHPTGAAPPVIQLTSIPMQERVQALTALSSNPRAVARLREGSPIATYGIVQGGEVTLFITPEMVDEVNRFVRSRDGGPGIIPGFVPIAPPPEVEQPRFTGPIIREQPVTATRPVIQDFQERQLTPGKQKSKRGSRSRWHSSRRKSGVTLKHSCRKGLMEQISFSAIFCATKTSRKLGNLPGISVVRRNGIHKKPER